MGYLSWIVLSAFYPLGSAAKYRWEWLMSAIREGCDAEVFLRSDSSNKLLVQAMVAMLRQVAMHGKAELTLERIEEAKSDVDISAWRPLLRPWNLKALLCVTWGSSSFVVEVTSCSGDGVVCGPKHELSHPVDFKIRVRANSISRLLALALRPRPQGEAARLAARQKTAMAFLREWLDDFYRDYMRTSVGMVEVLELQQDSKDWPPEWQSVRQEKAVRRSADLHRDRRSASSFYAVEKWAERILRHGEFAVKHHGRMRTSLFIHGQKGAGKTLFVEWLASELALPVYYIDLRSACLDDTTLRDAITPRKLRHNPPVIFHIDEFQSMMEAWFDRSPAGAREPNLQTAPTRVTIQGLQSVLEGIATPSNALFVFTGSRDLPLLENLTDGDLRHEWEGLLRRLPVRASIPPVSPHAALEFLSCFLASYLPAGSDAVDFGTQCDQLVKAWSFDTQPVPFDMLAKYCEQQLRDAFIRGLVVADADGMRVPHECVGTFLEVVFDHEALSSWPSSYAGGKLRARDGAAV